MGTRLEVHVPARYYWIWSREGLIPRRHHEKESVCIRDGAAQGRWWHEAGEMSAPARCGARPKQRHERWNWDEERRPSFEGRVPLFSRGCPDVAA